MKTEINIIGGYNYVRAQIVKHFSVLHSLDNSEIKLIDDSLSKALKNVQECWSGISNKYYNRDGIVTFDINHSNHYCQFLLILARLISSEGHSAFADKIFGLNKMLNGCDIYHEVILPKCFFIDHSVGLVVGRAKLGERLFLSQQCTIGSNPGDPIYPELGSDNYLMSKATLIGAVKTGDRVIFATGCLAKDIEIPSDSIVFGRTPENIIKKLKPESFKKASPFIL